MNESPVRPAGRALFVTTILAGSFLLFLVQPLIARIALPRLGGAPAVWNSAMLVYQALLLGGYAYAHALRRLPPRRQVAAQLAILGVAALWLPIGVLGWTLPAGVAAELWVPWLLVASIGPIFLAVAAQAPLVQRWYAYASGGADPYRLYAASNFGSFAGLIAYPLLVEPILPLREQRWLWSGGYLLLIALVAVCLWRLPRAGVAPHEAPAAEAAPDKSLIVRWVALAFVPSGLMLATTTYVTTDIVAMPLLWVIPLGLYLLSFTIAFAENRAAADLLTRIAPITILLFGGAVTGGFAEGPLFGAAVVLLVLFMAAVALHTTLYRARPGPAHLTGFYLAMAFGGALGGIFAGLVAPAVFDWTWEYPILILAAAALVPQVYLAHAIRGLWTANCGIPAFATIVFALTLLLILRYAGSEPLLGDGQAGAVFIVLAALGLASIGRRPAYLLVLLVALALFGGIRSARITLAGDQRMRSYFGIYTIDENARRRTLAHGTTLHGIELLGSPERERRPTSYYVASSGVGQAMLAAPALYGPAARIGVVGLGTGTLACYARPGQSWRFYEIDPTIARIARQRFRFLNRCAQTAPILIGDARLSIERAAPASLDLLALDAFSSDSIPIHLLTREAFAGYARVLSPRGLLLVHISSRFLELAPVVSATAQAGGWQAIRLVDAPSSLDESGAKSDWIAMSRDGATIRRLRATDPDWTPLPRYPGYVPWRDDYAAILPLLNY